jgi:hypothetical protein
MALGLVALIATSCTNDPPNDAKCPARAAFRLDLSALGGPLPTDTTVVVKYSGGVEEYRLGDSAHQQEAVLCQQELAGVDAGDAAAGDAGGPSPEVLSLTCDLWTQGAATVTATATGYPSKVKELEAQADADKCIITVPVDVVFGDEDAGS